MKNKTKSLILEILLIQERYLPEDFEYAFNELVDPIISQDVKNLIIAINKLNPETKRNRDSKVKNSKSTVSKSMLISRLRQGSRSVRYHLITEMSKKMKIGEEFGEPRPTAEDIIYLIQNMSDSNYLKMMSDIKTKENVDSNFMDLANFILKEK